MLRQQGDQYNQQNIDHQIIRNNQLLKTFFKYKFPSIYEMQNVMLINDLVDPQSKLILARYLQKQEVSAQIMQSLKNDALLMQFQTCLKRSSNRQNPDFNTKFKEFTKLIDKKCRNAEEPLTLKNEYEILLQEASKCFKLKASETRQQPFDCKIQETEEDEGQKRINAWKIDLEVPQTKTNFVCRFCQRNLRNNAGLSMHQMACELKNSKHSNIKQKKIKKKSGRSTRKGLRSSLNHLK